MDDMDLRNKLEELSATVAALNDELRKTNARLRTSEENNERLDTNLKYTNDELKNTNAELNDTKSRLQDVEVKFCKGLYGFIFSQRLGGHRARLG